MNRTFLSIALASFLVNATAAEKYLLIVPLKAQQLVPETPKPNDPSLAPITITMAPVQVGYTATPAKLVVTNNDRLALSITKVGPSAGALSPFSTSSTCGEINTGQSCEVTISLASGVVGSFQDSIRITHTGKAGESVVPVSAVVQAPKGELAALDVFGGVPLGSAKDVAYQVTNVGLGRLGLSPVQASVVTGTGFSFVEQNCPGSLAPGGSCQVLVRYSSTGAGESSGRLQLVTDGGPLASTLVATGAPSSLRLKDGSVAHFGTVSVGSSKVSTPITLVNTSDSAIENLSLRSSSASYKIENSTCGSVISAYGECNMVIRFLPVQGGSQRGELQVLIGEQVGAASPLLGVGSQEPLLLQAKAQNVYLAAGNTANVTYQVVNTGSYPVELQGLDLVHPSSDIAFSAGPAVASPCGAVLAGKASCSYSIQVQAKAFAAHKAVTATLQSSAGTVVDTGMLASGFSGPLTTNPASPDLSFGSVLIGDLVQSQLIELTNTMTLQTGYTLTKSLPAGFSIVEDSCGAGLANGKKCQFKVQFKPTEAKSYSGNIVLTSKPTGTTSYDYSTVIKVSGAGRAPSNFAWRGGDFELLEAGTASTVTWELYNFEQVPVTLSEFSFSASGSALTQSGSTCASTLQPGASCQVALRHLNGQEGVSTTGTVSIKVNGSLVSRSVTAGSGLPVFTANYQRLAYPTRYPLTSDIVETTATFEMALTNTGTATSENLAVTFERSTASVVPYTSALGCTKRLPVGSTCTFRAQIYASAVGDYTGNMVVTSGASVLKIPFTFKTEMPTLTVKTITAVASTKVGDASFAVFRVTNSNLGRPVVSIPKVSGNAAEFSLATGTTCNGTPLAFSGSCDVRVQFNPSATGARPAATLSLSIGGVAQEIPLSGTGT